MRKNAMAADTQKTHTERERERERGAQKTVENGS